VTDDLLSTLRFVVRLFDDLRIPYMVVGSIAGLAHGRTRATQDFDVVVEVDRARLLALVDKLPEGRFYVSMEAALESLRESSMFNIIDMETGWKVDVIPLKQRAFSRSELARKQRLEVLGFPLYVATLEDTIVAKLEWAKMGGGSRRQLEDVQELRKIAAARLDLAYVERWVRELGLEAEWEMTEG
jgi:hypothetical protein